MSQDLVRRLAALAFALLLALPGGCAMGASGTASHVPRPEWFGDDEQTAAEADDDDGHSLTHRLVLWIPNRIFDVFDIVRARLRVGPGFAVSVRATEFADAVFGGYTTVWAGLHGPRGEPGIPWPAWVEIFAGAGVSLVELTTEDGIFTPHYGLTEFGLGFQLGLIGLDVGIDPLEIVDFVVGLFTFDLIGDDF